MTEKGYVDSRERAKRYILSGRVTVDGKTVDKPSAEIEGEHEITVAEDTFVGRGGEKLFAAIALFSPRVKGVRALDIGASTGGFTDCLLRAGAASVVALDAGEGQLHPLLAADARVRSVEHYNARYLDVRDVGKFDLIVMDVSFISQTYVLPRLPALLEAGGSVITLVKPQFEAGRAALGKKGIVKSPKDRVAALSRVLSAAQNERLVCRGLMRSPITGGDGNIEYLAYFTLGETNERPHAIDLAKIVEKGEDYLEDRDHHQL